MNLYLLLPLFACATCCMLAVAILVRDARQLGSRLGATLVLTAAYWALCEVMWGAAREADAALLLVRLAAPGWLFIGPRGPSLSNMQGTSLV